MRRPLSIWFLNNLMRRAFFSTIEIQKSKSKSIAETQKTRPERSLIIIKPDGIQRSFIAKIINRFEQKGFTLVGIKLMRASETLLKVHYAHLAQKPFFPDILQYMTSGPVLPMIWEGQGIVKSAFVLIGATDPLESPPGSMRADFSVTKERNMIHRSDSIEQAYKEIDMWFKKEEIVDWHADYERWVYEKK